MTKPGLRKFALSAHVTSSVGWFGAVAERLRRCLGGYDQMARAASTTMELIGWFVIVPFSAASLLPGVVQSLVTSWGLFRHYWVIAKLLIAVVHVDTGALR